MAEHRRGQRVDLLIEIGSRELPGRPAVEVGRFGASINATCSPRSRAWRRAMLLHFS